VLREQLNAKVEEVQGALDLKVIRYTQKHDTALLKFENKMGKVVKQVREIKNSPQRKQVAEAEIK